MKAQNAILVLLALALTGCELFGPEPTTLEDAEIVPELGVHGVAYGSTMEEVTAILGEGRIHSFLDGAEGVSGTFFTDFKRDSAATEGLQVFFGGEGYNVNGFFVSEPYQGRTAKGIGVGSTQSELEAAYGEPDYPGDEEWPLMTYCFGSLRPLHIFMQDGRIDHFRMYGSEAFEGSRPC